MRAPLDRVLRLLGREAADPRSVVSAELDAEGRVLLRVNHQLGRSWLRQEGDRLIAIEPDADCRLPLASALAATEEEEAPEILAYRPGRRLVIRRRGANGVAIHKGYRPRRWQSAEERHRIAAIATTIEGGFKTPCVLAAEPATASLQLENLKGRPISVSESAVDDFYRVGASLRRFQESDLSERTQPFGPLDEIGVVKRWASRCFELTGWLPDAWDERMAALESAAALLGSEELALAHRDLHDGQLLFLDDGVGLLDFDLLCRADTSLDAANLLAHLTLRALQGVATESVAAACGRALIEGLDRRQEGGWWKRLRFYETTSFYRLALVYRHRPRWQALPPILLEYGSRCFEEVN